MKKKLSLLLALVLALSTIIAVPAFAVGVPYMVLVFGCGDEGLSVRSNPDPNSEKMGAFPDDNHLQIKQISDNGWGYISQAGVEGWVNLQWTKVMDTCTVDKPASYISPTEYRVVGTGNEGLELRVSPKVAASTWGPVPNGTVVSVQGISGEWAFTSYNGHEGWLNMTHLQVNIIQCDYNVNVFETGSEGLALKADANVNAARLAMIPEETPLHIDSYTPNGWGHTTYNGQNGWVALRYTKVNGNVSPAVPSYGFINPTFYKVVGNTEDNSLELRLNPTVESSSFGVVPEDTVVYVEAFVNGWAYFSYNGHKGWGHSSHLAETNVQVKVYGTGTEGLALKAAADGGSQRYSLIPDGTTLEIDKVSYGWGHTKYEGQEGWVAVRYTELVSKAEVVAPAKGFMDEKVYTVVNAEDGLAHRMAQDGENILLDVIPEGTEIKVTAIENNWAYTIINGQPGWVLSTYLKEK